MAPHKEVVRALVYRYVYWDDVSNSHKTSTLYATLPTIHNGLGTPVYEDAIYVDSDHLQGGIYVPPSESPLPVVERTRKADAKY